MDIEPMQWNIDKESIEDKKTAKCFRDKYRRAKSVMDERTRNHEVFSRISHMQNIYDRREDIFSEGSTQAIKRKLRQQTIQRVPDGELVTQFDKNSFEQTEIEFIFKNKIITSEYDGKDMMKNLWRTFNEAYDYGFGAVRTGFERDLDGDVRISYKHIQYYNVLPAPDCDFIEEADWYIERDYISRSDLEALIDEEGNCSDPTYNADVIKYILEHDIKDGQEWQATALADRRNGVLKIESIETWTLYERGADEFKTFVPAVEAVLRTVPNYDPRKDVPIHFMILEPDPEFPLGCSCVMWTLAQQQFADAFQTTAYDTLLLAMNPPLLTYGYSSNPKIALKPYSIWPMGTNPNAKIEKFPVETTSLTQYGSILQNISGNMMKNMNAADGTMASDANVSTYSGTPQGVQAQQKDKTIVVNQYQKRVEIFFAEFANHALRSYLNSMHGEQELTVDEATRRKIYDIERANAEADPLTGEPLPPTEDEAHIIGDKIRIDFDALNSDMLEFKVRTGSLVENEDEEERNNIQKLIVPISQMLPALPDEDKKAFVGVIMSLLKSLAEKSRIDISESISEKIDTKVLLNTQQVAIETLMQQQQQINQIMQMIMPPMEQGAPVEGQPDMAGAASVQPEGVSAEFPPQAGGPMMG